MDRRLPAAAVAAGTAAGAAFVIAPSAPGRWLLHALVSLCAAAAVVLGERAHRPPVHAPWWLIGAGLGILTAAEVGVGVASGRAGPGLDPAVAASYLFGGATVAVGIVWLVHVRAPRGAAGLVDAAIVATTTCTLLWEYIVAPRLATPGDGTTLEEAAILLVCLHAVAFAAGLRLLVTRAWSQPSFWLLLASGLCITAGDLPLVLLLGSVGREWTALWWILGYLLLGAAAAHPSMRPLTTPGPAAPAQGGRGRWAFLAAALLAIPFGSVWPRLFDPSPTRAVLPAGTLLVAALVAWRAWRLVADHDRASRQVTELADFNRSVLDSLMSLTAVLDRDGRVVTTNDPWDEILTRQHPRRARLWCREGESYLDTLRQAAAQGIPDAEQAADAVAAVLGGDRPDARLDLAAYLDGERRWFIMRVTRLAAASGGVVIAHHDVTWRQEAEEELRIRADQQATVSWLGQHALTDADLDALLDEAVTMAAVTLSIESCTALERLPDDSLVLRAGIGWSESDIGMLTVPGSESLAGFASRADEPVVAADLARDERFPGADVLLGRGYRHGLAVAIPGRGEPWGVLAAHSASERVFTRDDAHFFQAVANVVGGSIERRRSEDEARHAALHDPLTGLPNRALLLDRLSQALARAPRLGSDVAVLFIDVDDFKATNVALGHAAGDELLIAIASRLAALVRPEDTVARLSGDELVVVCERVADARAAEVLGARAASAFDTPFVVRGSERHITASIGIAVAADASRDPEALLRSADTAMRRAKRQGRGLRAVFDEDLRARTDLRRRIAEDLRGAVSRGELSVVYQPVVSVLDGHLVAAEALVRWHHPTHGPISPALFIPVAEESGTIDEIGSWVLHQTCRQVGQWRDLLPDERPFTVYVNLSARQLAQGDFPQRVTDALTAGGADASRLGLEITESLLLHDVEGAARSLEALKSLGITLAMDDFGTGFSSLSYLKRLPLDVVKVDRSFVDGLGEDEGDSAIVAAVVRMAAALRLRVTAEGVETERQLAELRALGCDLAQGYLFARPLAPADLHRLLER